MSRRALPLGSHGEITYAPAARGGWRARCHFRGLDGIRVRVEKTGRTKDQARQLLLAELLDRSQALGSETLNGESTMRELAELFFERLSLDNSLLPKTIAKYRSSIEAFVAMTESVRLREMTPALIENRLHRIPSKDKAFKTRQMLTRMFNYALLQDAVTMNPVTATSPIRRERPDVIETMTDVDIHKVRAAVRQWAGAHERPGPKNHDMIDLIEVLLATGIRIGEALALRWSDLALDDPMPTLTINGQVDYEPGRGAFRKATKTKHSNRVFVLPPFAATALRTRKMLMPPNDLDAVFVTRNGTWHQESNMQKRLRRIRHEAGLEWVKFHTFRRTVGTEVGNTIDSDAAAALLGHGSSAITERHYIEKQRRVVDVSSVLQDRFAQPVTPPVSPAEEGD